MAAAAMRFGHNLVNGEFTLQKDNDRIDSSNNLTQRFFDSDIVYIDGKFLSIQMLSIILQPTQPSVILLSLGFIITFLCMETI